MFYNLFLVAILLFQGGFALFSKKRFPKVFSRFFFPKELFIPRKDKFWFHAVSFGEVKAILPFLQKMKERYPEGAFFISTITVTGFEEARKIPFAKAFYLPFDFSWIQKRIIKIAPKALFLVEGDFWKNMLYFAKKAKAKVILINGKISERSSRRFSKVPFFAKKLFSSIDLFLVQSSSYEQNFIKLNVTPSKLFVTGNIKLYPSCLPRNSPLEEKVKKALTKDFIITIGSSHDPEEKELVQELLPLIIEKNIKIFLVPRHPERASSIVTVLEKLSVKIALFSIENPSFAKASIILVDQMGVLSFCYKYSKLALVAGSFNPSLEGHNLIEPALQKTPVIFGPYTSAQTELKELVLRQKMGKVLSVKELFSFLQKELKNPKELLSFKEATGSIEAHLKKPLEKTWDLFLDKACLESLSESRI